MSKIKIIIASLLVLTIVLVFASVYIVEEKEQAVVFQFGDPVNILKYESGQEVYFLQSLLLYHILLDFF